MFLDVLGGRFFGVKGVFIFLAGFVWFSIFKEIHSSFVESIIDFQYHCVELVLIVIEIPKGYRIE